MSGCGCGIEAQNIAERKTLWLILWLNAMMFVIELVAGWLVQSTGLVADSLDMLADAGVYAISLYAIGKSAQLKVRAATISGIAQIVLACLVISDVTRRFVFGSEPAGLWIVAVGFLALLVNISCFALINRHRDSGVHMRASWIFSKNDVIANLGVMLAGALVWVSGSRYPDLIIGFVIAFVVMRGGFQILADAKAEQSATPRE